MAGLRCYHHSNCEDHPAVATCSKCGKGLCRECADNLRSEETGKILCVDCLNAELNEEVAWGLRIRNTLRRELITIIVGFIIGLIVQIVLGSLSKNDTSGGTITALFYLSLILCLPTLFASFGTIWRTTQYAIWWILKIPFFIILCLVSPIMFIVRIVKHAKRMKLAKNYAVFQIRKQIANDEYAECARQMVTVTARDEFERDLKAKYATLSKQNKEEADRLIAEERAQREALEQRNAELAKELEAKSEEIRESDKGMKEIQARDAKIDAARKRNKASRRSTDSVDSGKKAA